MRLRMGVVVPACVCGRQRKRRGGVMYVFENQRVRRNVCREGGKSHTQPLAYAAWVLHDPLNSRDVCMLQLLV